MKDRKDLFLLVVFVAFLAVVLPMVSIPADIGEHSYTGGIYNSDTGEQIAAVTVELSGKRIYALGRDQFDPDGRIVIEAETFQNDSDLDMCFDESLGVWTYGPCSFGAFNHSWNGYDNAVLAYRGSYFALVLPLQKDGRTLYLSAVENEAAQTPQNTLTDFLTAIKPSGTPAGRFYHQIT